MYNAADGTWAQKPKFIGKDSIELLFFRIEEFIGRSSKARILIELHGGEPLLFGKQRMSALLEEIRRRFSDEQVGVALQTNALLLDQEWLDIFIRNKCRLSFSCDGPPEIHDKFRKDHRGHPTGKKTIAAIDFAYKTRGDSKFVGGVLAVASPHANGKEVVRFFYNLGVKGVDFLLPDGNFAYPPAHFPKNLRTSLIDFYRDAFDEWIKLQNPKFRIRIFEEFIRGIMGVKSKLDGFGGDISSIVVVDTDGSYEKNDVLKICGESHTKTGNDLANESLHSQISGNRFFFSHLAEPTTACKNCRAFKSCGGGYLPHRFDGKGFNNPSYNCDVLLGIYDHIYDHMRKVIPDAFWGVNRTDKSEMFAR